MKSSFLQRLKHLFQPKPRLMALLCCYGVSAALLVTGIAGCATKPLENKAYPSGTITLQFWTLQLGTFAPYIQEMIGRYEAQHPGVRIQWVDVPFSQGEKRALTAMMSEQVPDVVNLNPDFSAVLATRRAVLDMNRWVGEATRKRYLDIAWQASSLDMAGESLAFGVPWYLTSKVTLYNAKLLEKAGYNTPPKDYQALRTLAEALHRQGANVLMPPLSENGFFLKELRQAGIPAYDPETGRMVFADNPKAVKHLEYWLELYRERLIPAEALTESHQAAIDRYQGGSLALLLTGPNFLNIVKENAPAVYQATNVAPQFPQAGSYKDFSTMVLVVPRKSKHPREAVEFALYVTNETNQLALAKLAPVLPSRTQALKDPYFQMPENLSGPDAKLSKGRAISAQQLLSARLAPRILPNQNQLNRLMDYYVQSALLGKQKPAEALANAQREMNLVLDAAKPESQLVRKHSKD